MSQMDNMLINACKNGQKGVAQTLLSKGDVDVNKRDAMGFTALHYACQKGARDLVSLLLASGADASACSNDSTTPLHMCSRSGNKDVIRMLLDAGADVNATDRNGRTPIMGMASEGKTDAAKMLLENGADPTMADNDGHARPMPRRCCWRTAPTPPWQTTTGTPSWTSPHPRGLRAWSPHWLMQRVLQMRRIRSATPRYIRPAGTPRGRSSVC